MPWILSICTIDVGQGESALIIARNTDNGGQARTMLIDGGLPGYASTVNDFVQRQLAFHRLQRVDVVLTSHFDDDHSGGIVSLLQADIFEASAEIVGAAAARAADAAIQAGCTGRQVIAAAAAAASAAACGAYDAPDPPHCEKIADEIARDVCIRLPNNITGNQAVAEWGVKNGVHVFENTEGKMNSRVVEGPVRRKEVAIAAGICAGTANTQMTLIERVRGATEAAYDALKSGIPSTSRFRTHGAFRKAILVDSGSDTETAYVNAIQGKATFDKATAITVPTAAHAQRSLTQVDLAKEVLWDTRPGSGVGLAPVNAPAAFVVATAGWVWSVPKPKKISLGADSNGLSVGLVLRFGHFYFFTGGDLPSAGEEAVADTVMKRSLPDSRSGEAFPPPQRFAAFKCGHHGSGKSTSEEFIAKLAAPVAILSVGKGRFGRGKRRKVDEDAGPASPVTDLSASNDRTGRGKKRKREGDEISAHPSQDTIDRLHNSKHITKFYLTNCNFDTDHVPASSGRNQIIPPPPLPGDPPYSPNKSRVAGDNSKKNLDPNRPRGDIILDIREINAFAQAPSDRVFTVSYFDDDEYKVGRRSWKTGEMTNNHWF